MLAFLEGPDLLIVLVIVLLVFGGSKVPQLARSLGEAQREFRKASGHDPAPEPAAEEAPPPAETTTPADGAAGRGPAPDDPPSRS